ncbi:NlpC/P60 family protein [Nonomuraea deserti]|uniref:NlpC/P60 family protein n=2 Tax=Nonomuraea deserti TaxID=1848322 RepID=A0A4V2YAP9_9ACTN|nr:NlpC/P60 family protein [Nonomuraea deserti]
MLPTERPGVPPTSHGSAEYAMKTTQPPLATALTLTILGAMHSTPALAAHRCGAHSPGHCRMAAETAAAARSPAGAIAVRAAIEMIGVPYSWGGGGVRGPGYGVGRGAGIRGFDCSGLTEYAWARAGVLIGTTTYEQWRSGVRIAKEDVQPGDLVFYDSDRSSSGPEHVAVAVDATRMVHAPYTGALVRIDPLDRRTFLGIVRPSESVANVAGAKGA